MSAIKPRLPGMPVDYPHEDPGPMDDDQLASLRGYAERQGFINGHWYDRTDLSNLAALQLLDRLDRAERAAIKLRNGVREIASRGPVFDHKGTESQRICDVANRLLYDPDVTALPDPPKHSDAAAHALDWIGDKHEPEAPAP